VAPGAIFGDDLQRAFRSGLALQVKQGSKDT
jgi:hypothetical protein